MSGADVGLPSLPYSALTINSPYPPVQRAHGWGSLGADGVRRDRGSGETLELGSDCVRKDWWRPQGKIAAVFLLSGKRERGVAAGFALIRPAFC